MKKMNRFYRPLCGFAAVFLASLASAQLLINPPTFPSSNTVELTLSGAASTNAHIIFFTPDLTASSIAAWSRLTTGAVGQVTFDLTRPTNDDAFFAAGVAPISTPTVATPVFTPGGGSYSTPTNVVVTCATEGAVIYYTTDDSTPTTSSTYIYNGGSIYLSSVVTLKAKAFATGYNDSGVASATYTINSPPTVNAGPQQIISSSPTTLQGTVADDGLGGGGTTFTNWTKISGPGTVTFGNSHQTNSTASFSANGIYVLQLSASDGQYTNSSQVTIAYNPTLSVSMTAPSDGSSYTVPTNILLQATASCSSGSVTQLLFYANSTLIGAADTQSGNTFSLNWKSVSSGSLALTAVAVSSDPNNYSLASDPVNITVNWPTNVGQVAYSSTDLQIPAAGLPITVNREYNTQYGTSGSFGNNGKLDYEDIKISESSAMDTGWHGTISSGIYYTIAPTTQHLVTISLGNGENYYFVAQYDFDLSGSPTITAEQPADGYYSYWIHLECVPLGQGQLTVTDPANQGDTVGIDDNYGDWTGSYFVPSYFDDSGLPSSNYNPDFSQFTFTAPDGTKYGFNGDGTIASKTDRNGNTLSYSSSGISSSTGRQVQFTRDGNRITEIYDPIAINTSGSPVLKYTYDSIGNLTNAAQLVQRSPAVYENTSYAYTNTTFPNNLTSVTDARGITTQRYEYDSEGRLYKQYDAYGRAITYAYDTVTHQQTITDRNGYPATQTFTPAGQLSSLQDASGGVTSFGYDSQGNKISETDPADETTTYAYDANGQLIAQTNALDESASATYNNFGEVLVSIDNLGHGTTNAYDANGNLLFSTNTLGIVTAYGYDSQGNPIAITNGLGLTEEVVMTNGYDQYGDLMGAGTLNANGQLMSQTSYTYDDDGNKLTETKTRTAGAVVTQWHYDAANRVIQTINADGFTNSIVYNGIGRQTDAIDALGRTNQFFYDADALLTNETFADGTFENYAYDANGNRTNFVDRANHPTSYTYDPLGRLVQTTYADGNYTVNTYDAAGRLKRKTETEVVSGGGMSPPVTIDESTSYYYDAAGRRTNTVNALNQPTEYTFDANGNQTSVIDALNHTNIYIYDELNRQTEVIYPDGTHENYGYDAIGNRIAVTNQANVVTRYSYDAGGRLAAVTNAFGTSQQIVTRYVYDEVGNMLQQIDALNHTNEFEYDGVSHQVKETLPGNQVALSGYDAAGNLIRYTNFNNVVITNQYDALNRLTNKASINGYHVSFAYSPTGQRTNMVDASGTTSYTYDNRDRLKTKVAPEGTLTYTYDGFGNVTTMQSSTTNGTSLTYSYDLLNRLTNAVDRFTNSTTYSFDSVGNLQTEILPNSVTNTYGYDSLNRLTNITTKSSSGTNANFAYQLAPTGNRTNLVEKINGVSRTNQWAFDPLYRLTNEMIVASSGGSISYKYDGVGNRTNRTSAVSGVGNQSFTYNVNDQLTTDSYDANGSTTNAAGNTYAYDVENQLTNYNNGTVIYVFDGDGNRVKKTVSGVTTYYLIDDRNPSGYAQVLEELTTIGTTPSRLYSYGLNLISQRQSNGTTSFYGFDGNGNTRFLTSSSGTISDTYAYDAFGDLLASTGTTPNDYLFAGQQHDANLGFYYLRARYMNPATGRFWTRDSFEGNSEDPLSLHKYLYAEDDPADHVDPSGNDIGDVLDVLDISASLDSFSLAPTVLAESYARSHIASLSPEILYVRSFAPWKTFGYVPFYGTFSGDNRGFTTAHVPGGVARSAAGATSRITSIVKFTLSPFAIVSQVAYSDPSHDSAGATATGTPHVTVTTAGSAMHLKMWGSNPLVSLAPDIDVKLDMTLTIGSPRTYYDGKLYGDAFPDAEVFIVDPGDHATMLETFTTSGGQTTGPAVDLPGDNSRPMGSFSKWVTN
jgi:RHS repeat-associated protein